MQHHIYFTFVHKGSESYSKRTAFLHHRGEIIFAPSLTEINLNLQATKQSRMVKHKNPPHMCILCSQEVQSPGNTSLAVKAQKTLKPQTSPLNGNHSMDTISKSEEKLLKTIAATSTPNRKTNISNCFNSSLISDFCDHCFNSSVTLCSRVFLGWGLKLAAGRETAREAKEEGTAKSQLQLSSSD